MRLLRNSDCLKNISLLDNFLLAITYFLTAKLGQIFAISPGNITPVWIPSGIILAAVLMKGYRVGIGIFLGAFAGNIFSYFNTDSLPTIINSVIAGTANGIGDVLCAVIGGFLILNTTKTNFPFTQTKYLFKFLVFGVVIGALISAFFGVTTLCMTNFVSWDKYIELFLTWSMGDGVGILLITPMILSWTQKNHKTSVKFETIIYGVILIAATFYSFGFFSHEVKSVSSEYIGLFTLLPLIMWSAFRFPLFITNTSIVLVASIAVVSTYLNVGWIIESKLNNALIELQLFISFLATTTLILNSVICEKNTSEKALKYLAHHDPLTNLPNKLLFNLYLQKSIQNSIRNQTLLTIIFVDLDRFKQVNDSFGHLVGDELLRQVAERLKKSIRANDTISRISGDEFVILLENIENPLNVRVVLDKLISSFEKPFIIQENKIYMRSSMGVSMFPQDGKDAEQLIRNADIAMYRAKENGRNTYQFFTEELMNEVLQQALIDRELKTALEKEEFQLVYQPQIDLISGDIVGLEVLIRWHNSQLGIVSPACFIPIAEQNGMISEIGLWVLKTACYQGKSWLDRGLNLGQIAINVSGRQIQKTKFFSNIKKVLEKTQFPVDNLEIEITESVVMSGPEDNIERLNKIKSLGIQITIDDFGTGYSSLSYLKRLPIDKLKIDRSFISDLNNDPNNMAITTCIIAMGQALNLKIIAEGVETEKQAEFLKHQHCNEAQGYLYSQPLTVDELELFLSSNVSK